MVAEEHLDLSTDKECNRIYEQWWQSPAVIFEEHPARSPLAKKTGTDGRLLEVDADVFIRDLVHQWSHMLSDGNVIDEYVKDSLRRVRAAFSALETLRTDCEREIQQLIDADPNYKPGRNGAARGIAKSYARQERELEGFLIPLCLDFVWAVIRAGVTFHRKKPSAQWKYKGKYPDAILCNPGHVLDYLLDMLVLRELLQARVVVEPMMVGYVKNGELELLYLAVALWWVMQGEPSDEDVAWAVNVALDVVSELWV